LKKKIYLLCAVPFILALVTIAVILFLPPRFEYELRPVVTVTGRGVGAGAFLYESELMADVIAYFYAEVDFTLPGRQEVTLTLQRGTRETQAEGVLYILEPLEYLIVELGEGVAIDTQGINLDPLYFVANAHEIPPELLDVWYVPLSSFRGTFPVGNHRVFLAVGQTSFYSELRVVDTTPPTATTRDITLEMGREITADDVVVEMFDHSPITSVTVVQPDIFMPGEHVVEIILTDAFENAATYTAVVTLLPNEIPPVFHGVQDIKVAQGEPIRFRAGVTAEDAFGRPIVFDIDASQVNIYERGIYRATFTATDAWGLSASVTVDVHILSIDPAAVNEMADNLLAQILREGMTQVQQARTILHWLGDNISYAAAVGLDSVYEAAHQGMIHRRGNCFIFYGLAEVMLTRAGIPNQRIERTPYTPNPTHHRWNLINPDGLGWHHFDATSNRVLSREDRFMFTNSQAEAHTRRVARGGGMVDFYTFIPDLHPEIVE
jgi:transglutaminase-like putative cysteine protease